jgi:S1-C subfamily serine protease
LPSGVPPLYPQIFGTGFFADREGIVLTNRHVVEVFDHIPKHPKTGESGLAAILFLIGEDRRSCQMLVVDIEDITCSARSLRAIDGTV